MWKDAILAIGRISQNLPLTKWMNSRMWPPRWHGLNGSNLQRAPFASNFQFRCSHACSCGSVMINGQPRLLYLLCAFVRRASKNILQTSQEAATRMLLLLSSTRSFNYMLTTLLPFGHGATASVNISLWRALVLQQSLVRSSHDKLLLIYFPTLQCNVKHQNRWG